MFAPSDTESECADLGAINPTAAPPTSPMERDSERFRAGTRCEDRGRPRGCIANSLLEEVLALHFDERHGSPYWLDARQRLGFDPRREIHRVEDLVRFGPFDREHLTSRPLSDFIPKRLYEAHKTEFILAETGGTVGRPVRSVYLPEEFVQAFGTPFTTVSATRGFPYGGSWLFIGPSGPHVIGQAARLLARLHGSLEPFAVDLDPRHARAQEPNSLGARLYREHVLDQALDILEREAIDVLFITPPLAVALAEALSSERRERITGIHLGGMTVTSQVLRALEVAFPRAVILPAYGNSLFGILPELTRPEPDGNGELHLDYFPLDCRLRVEVVTERDDGTVNITRAVAPGERGRVMMSRLDRSFFLPNLVERDRAIRRIATDRQVRLGFGPIGVRDPEPLANPKLVRGLY